MMHYILAHFIGDFLLQNDNMAKNKKHNISICLSHVLYYLIPFALFVDITLLQIILIGAQHFMQDKTNFIAWWCKKTGAFQSETLYNEKYKWGHIIVDQIFHCIWLWIVFEYVK